MPDINPAELSRPSISLSTPILSTKSITVSTPATVKAPKTSQIIPARIDLEPIYTSLKSAIGSEQWTAYKEAVSEFFIGRLNQTELFERISPILPSPNGERQHLHNQLLAAIYGNVTREMPDQGLAPWVSANDKPTGAGSKPVSGDATERYLKEKVMQLPSRDRRRIKDLVHNDFDPFESFASIFSDHHKARPRRPPAEVPPSAGGLNQMNFDLEIRKKYAQPLAVESGEFPDISNIESRMLPCCYEAGLVNGHAPEAGNLMLAGTEFFVKEVLSCIFSRTRSNAPGESGSAGMGQAAGWIQTHKYKRQLAREEDAATRGEVTRDKGGLLPVESKAAGERGPLGLADLQLALEIGDFGTAQFPIIAKSIANMHREGETETWEDYTWPDGREAAVENHHDTTMTGTNGQEAQPLTNGINHSTPMEIDDEVLWDGADLSDMEALDNVLESCLTVG